jgi:hypothetical protein
MQTYIPVRDFCHDLSGMITDTIREYISAFRENSCVNTKIKDAERGK